MSHRPCCGRRTWEVGVLGSVTCAESYWKKWEMLNGQKEPTTLFPMRDLEIRFRRGTSQL